ncbi:scavenger receptor cysteine-rich type 1 protein M130-like [Montipora capricornis]|uniref:scavenger receptor cysteine-rich type 1 protein M130-like n=1 Tax=Montipora capricornis TaxID=246305 RepID=UPI0035F12480
MISLSNLTFVRLLMLYSDTHIRLTGHTSSHAGRVEVFSNGIWGRVSSRSYWSSPWRRKEAAVVCRQLGFPGVITALSWSAFGEGSGPVVMSDVQCAGTEKTLQQCQYRDMVDSYLGDLYGVGVVCKTHSFYSSDIDIPIRLQGSTLASAGRVEVFYAGVWGSISSDNWYMNDDMATVVCRQLGYQDGEEKALKNRIYGPFFGPVWLTNLYCTGNEKNVMECAHDVIGNKSEEMRTYRFASVICKGGKMLGELKLRLKGSHLPNMGRVEVHFDGKWGSIYPWGWSSSSNKTAAMTVVCRQLGYAAAVLSGSGAFCSDNTVLPWFTNLRCNGSETSLNQCGLQFHSSTSVGCMSVFCTNETADTGYKLRLRGSSMSHAGRVEIRIQGVWGSIFHYWWSPVSSETRLVICRQLGFNDSILWTAWSTSGVDIIPQWFASRDILCLGNETNVMDCVSSTQPILRRNEYYQDVGVICKPNISQIKDFQVRLAGSNLPFAGTIEMSYYGVWGGTLYNGMDIRVGHVACRQLGYSGAQQVFPRGFFGKGKGPLLMSRMTCNGNESDLSQCTSETIDTHWSWYWHYYYYWTDNAGAVLCANANVGISKDFSVRLAGSPISNAGRVEVFYAGIWGTIFGYRWSLINAHVVCRQLGYPGAISSGQRGQFGFGKSLVWFRYVRCLGNESSFQECPKFVAGYFGSSYLATALCKLPYQQGTFQNCSNLKCTSNGKCINTPAGAVCNCTDGFSGLQCEIPSFNPCQSSCQNGGQCFRNESSFLCACPRGLTGKLCEEKIVNVVDPCLSRPCTNKTSCYHNGTHHFCLTIKDGNLSEIGVVDPCLSRPCTNKTSCYHNGTHHFCLTIKDGNLSEIGGNSMSVNEKAAINTYIIAISASIFVVLVAVVVCLVFKIRRLNTQLKSRPRDTTKSYNNNTFQADPVNEVAEGSSTSLSHRDLGLGYANNGAENDIGYDNVFEMSSRPLPAIPSASQRSDPLPRIGKSPVYDCSGEQKSESRAVRYAGLQGRGMNSAEVTVAEPSSYMSLSSRKPEHHDGVYSGLTYNGEVAIAPKQKTKKGKNNGRLYANTQK